MAWSDPVQLIIIGVIVVAIFLWGPQKIPELARALGKARKEFEEGSKELESVAVGGAHSPSSLKSSDQILIETARALGISTEGKTREQISQEIIDKKS